MVIDVTGREGGPEVRGHLDMDGTDRRVTRSEGLTGKLRTFHSDPMGW